MKKKIGELLGSKWISFYKIVASIFEKSIEMTGKLILQVDKKIKNIEQGIGQETNLL